MGLEPASVCVFTLSNMNISGTSWPINIKFHLEHHWGRGLASLGFGLDRISIKGVYSFCLFCNYVCLSVCLSVCKLFFPSKISQQLLGLGF